MIQNSPIVGILDYGVGNIFSLQQTLLSLGYAVIIGRSERELKKATTIFLPGVGAFNYAMENLKKSGMNNFLEQEYLSSSRRLIGICLGMQLFFDFSEEGMAEGLGIISGEIKVIPKNICHVGWSIVDTSYVASTKAKEKAFYFNHTYFAKCSSKYIKGGCNLGNTYIPSIINSKEFFGVQFHPEKSQSLGKKLLKELIV